MEFRLLGALEVETGGRLLPFRGAKERALLAALLLRANEVVSREWLIEELWHGHAPTSSVHSLEVYISRLRRTLGGDGASIESHPGGYRLRVDPEQLDRSRFERLVEEGWRALAAGDAHAADERLGEALALWRGRPLSELGGEPTAELEADRLEELRLSALEGQLEAQLALRRHVELVGRLRPLVATYPLREGLQRLLMLALYRCGRQAEALDVYRQARRRLVEELGLEPGKELQRLQEAILHQDPALDLPAAETTPRAEVVRPPPDADARPRLERKLVTVLACDLASTARSGTTDPEDVRTLLLTRRRQVQTELEQFGGTVETVVGDTAVAVFGAPLAHEDDPERAVRAALAIRDRALARPDLHVRIGLATGEALVMLEATPAPGEETVSGLVVASAAQLREAAPLDGILADERTHRATERAVESRPGPPIGAAVTPEPGAVWEVVRARSPIGAEPAVRAAAPLIGRDPDLAVLTTALERASERRQPQLVTIVGVPGIGKTRMIAELRAAAERDGRLLTWLQGRSLPYGDGASFWALAQIVKSEAGILESDSADETARKLQAAVERLALEAAEAGWVASHVRRLAGLAGDGRGGGTDRRGEAFAAWRRFVEALAEQCPLVLVFEDLHWADDGLLDFLEELTDRLADVPVLLLASARPELLQRRPAWGGGKPNATTLSLSALSDEETERLVHALLGSSPLPASMISRLAVRAGGNPLYAEELVRMAAERDSDELSLPDTVQASIGARLDTLHPRTKLLLQDAAVSGDVFWPGGLRALNGDASGMEECLDELERLRFIRREERSALAGERQYAFRHVLIRDVAYGTIPRAARLERHRRAAEWVESLGRPDDHADLLAHHYRSALELAQETGATTSELESATVAAVLRAGDRAYELNAFPTAARFYDEALAIGVAEERLGHVLFRLGAALNLAFDERRIEVLEHARETLLAAGGQAEAAEASALLADIWWKLGRPDRNRQELARARKLLERAPVSSTQARVLAQAARYAWLWMQPEEALRLAREALAIGKELGLDDVVVSTLNTIGCARIALGDRTGGAADLERAIELGLRIHDPETATAYNNLAGSLDTGERLERSRELNLEGQRVAARLGNEPMVRFISTVLLTISYQAGEWDEALAAANAILDDGTAGPPDRNARRAAQLVRAFILLARDDEARADSAIRDALAQMRVGGSSSLLGIALSAAALVFRGLGQEGEARAAAEELLTLIRPDFLSGITAHFAFALEPLDLGDALRDALTASPAGEAHRVAHAIVDRDYVRAADLLAAGGSRTLEAEARFRAAAALGEAGHTAEAEEQLDKALAFYRTVGAARYIRTGETLRSRLHEEAPRSR